MPKERLINIKGLIIIAACLIFQATVFGQKTINDTTFIIREYIGGTYHAVFVCKPGETTAYKVLSDNPAMANTQNTVGLPSRWLPLYVYRHRYYLYYPCDGIYFREYALSDSFFTKLNDDGFDTVSTQLLKPIDKDIYQAYNLANGRKESLTIYILDKRRQIALFHYQTSDSTEWNELVVGAEKAKYFPIIVCISDPDYIDDFTFDTPDYKVLLKTKKP